MTRIVMVGYQGMGNVGDEAILAGIEELLRETGIEVIAVTGGGRAPVAAFPGAQRVPIPRFLPGRDLWRAIRRADLLVMAGGGLLNDYWPTLIPRLLAWSLVARMLGTRVGWLAAGVGPVRHRRSRCLVRLVLGMASFISVRDEASAALVTSIRGGARPRVVPDPALFLSAPPAAATTRGLALIVRSMAPGTPGGAALVSALVDVAAEEILRGAPVTLLTMQSPEDAPMVEAIQATIRARTGAELGGSELPVDPERALIALAGFEAIVSVRLHGVLLAALAARPWVAIAYDPKVEAAGLLLDAPQLVLPVPGLTGTQLKAALADARRPQRLDAVAAALVRLRGQRGEVLDWVNEVIG